jgi:hypothetical protein
MTKSKYSCRFHPTDSFHQVGCEHVQWTKEQLQQALDTYKQTHQDGYLQGHIDHQLVLEASTKDAAEALKNKQPESVHHTYSGEEILRKARQEGVVEGLERAKEIVRTHKTVNDDNQHYYIGMLEGQTRAIYNIYQALTQAHKKN